jgi:SpoVK/Ycf46/Vps4 family AAA+-type ATPase
MRDSNAIVGLPEEIIRAGRFDAVFFVDLPNKAERETILNLLLEKYRLDHTVTLTHEILEATENFSGAEMEQAFLEALYDCAEKTSQVNAFVILREIRNTVPLAATMEDRIRFMREWSAGRARPASGPDHSHRKERRKGCPISQRLRPN